MLLWFCDGVRTQHQQCGTWTTLLMEVELLLMLTAKGTSGNCTPDFVSNRLHGKRPDM